MNLYKLLKEQTDFIISRVFPQRSEDRPFNSEAVDSETKEAKEEDEGNGEPTPIQETEAEEANEKEDKENQELAKDDKFGRLIEG